MKVCGDKLSIQQIDNYIMPACDINFQRIDLTSPLWKCIGNFVANLGLVHKYKQQAGFFGGRCVPWKTRYQVATGRKLVLSEDKLFDLYNYVTTTKSEFGNLIRNLNELSADKWRARYYYDFTRSLSSINEPFRETCWKYCHEFPNRIQTAFPGKKGYPGFPYSQCKRGCGTFQKACCGC
jgi:hypothetical protein